VHATPGCARVRRQDKRNRRINVLGALAQDGPEPELVWTSRPTKIDAGVLLEFVCTGITRPTVRS
jgi:hypothetical protein